MKNKMTFVKASDGNEIVVLEDTNIIVNPGSEVEIDGVSYSVVTMNSNAFIRTSQQQGGTYSNFTETFVYLSKLARE